ncbi:MAG: hypothetical protein F7C38_02165 [Desulfurococcales archaeon]|nr:hypothetical protein [Desulfurococcales archaeon]
MPSMMHLLRNGLTAPFKAVVSPGRVFAEIRRYTRQYGIYFTASFYIGAWLGISMATFVLVMLAVAFHSLIGLKLLEFAIAPLEALVYSFLFPLVAAGIDSILIMIPVLLDRNRPPIHAVLAVRASSMLPYSLRIVYLAITGDLHFKSLVSASTSPIGLALLVVGFLLTAYGLVKVGVGKGYAAVGAVLPLLYKLVV